MGIFFKKITSNTADISSTDSWYDCQNQCCKHSRQNNRSKDLVTCLLPIILATITWNELPKLSFAFHYINDIQINPLQIEVDYGYCSYLRRMKEEDSSVNLWNAITSKCHFKKVAQRYNTILNFKNNSFTGSIRISYICYSNIILSG